MKTKKYTAIRQFHFYIAAALLGIVMFAGVFILSTQYDMTATAGQLEDTVNYIKKQCDTSNTLNLASEAKSLLRLKQGAEQIRRDLCLNQNAVDEALLAQYTREQRLTGIVLLDAEGNIRINYGEIIMDKETSQELISTESVLDVMQYPEKVYASRIGCEDGSYTDMAVCGRKDQTGIIVVYYHTPITYIDSYSLSFQHLLSGYSADGQGTIVITQGDTIVASNAEELIGKSTDDVPVLLHIKQRARDGELVHVKTGEEGISQSFGVIDRGRDYYVYAYIPERDVFTSTPRNLLLILIVYVFILVMIRMMHWKTEQQYRKMQLKREQEYQEKLKVSARRAESANVAKTEFLQRMSHDIRTPINGIRGMVEIGDHYSDNLEKQAECRRKIWDASGLLLELVNEVLDMGKLESGEIILESRPFNIVDIIESIRQVLDRQATERGITISCDEMAVEHPELIGSPLHVKRLLMNIMSNAVKYNKENGSVRIRCREVRCEKDMAWIEVVCADTGIGMKPEFQKHIFEPFTQENQDARSTYSGTGLGMAITKSLVDKMGGTITFESALDVGTTYFITIPFVINTGAQTAQEKTVAEPVELAGKQVLLAEDNELNMEIAQFLLENAGIVVTKAANGQEAVDIFQASVPGTFDAILMDVMMPELDGYQATQLIRMMEREDAKKIPILAMTANAFVADRKKAYEAGMNEHLTKPLETETILRTLDRQIRFYRQV